MPPVRLMAATGDRTIFIQQLSTLKKATCVSSAIDNATIEITTPDDMPIPSSLTIEAISAGKSHFILQLSDSTLFTVSSTCSPINPSDQKWLARGTTAACGPIGMPGAYPRVSKFSAGDDVTVVWACETSTQNCRIVTYGDTNALLGNGGSTSEPAGTPNFVTFDSELFPYPRLENDILAIESGQEHVLVLLKNRLIIGWGDTPGAQIQHLIPVEILNTSSLIPATDTIIQLSAVGRAVFLLSDKGKIFAWGESYASIDASQIHDIFPVLIPQAYVPASNARRLLELELINGVRYQYTSLMKSQTFRSGRLPFLASAVATSLDATPIAPPAGSTLRMASWGDNVHNYDYPPLYYDYSWTLSLESMDPNVYSPRYMFPSAFSGPNPSNPFPIDLASSKFAFSNDHGFALNPQGEVWVWGGPLWRTTPADIQPLTALPNTAYKHFLDVSKISSWGDGVMIQFLDGTVACSTYNAVQENFVCANPMNLTKGAAVFSSLPLNPSHIACISQGICVLLYPSAPNSITVVGQSYSNWSPTIYDFGSTVVIHGAWAAKRFDDGSSNAPAFHFNYTDTALGATQFGWFAHKSSLPDPQQMTPVGLLSSQVQSLVVGNSHVLVLLNNGSLAGWGWSNLGELAIVDRISFFGTAIPVLETYFLNLLESFGANDGKITQISASGHSSMALLANGNLYTWGANGIPWSTFETAPSPTVSSYSSGLAPYTTVPVLIFPRQGEVSNPAFKISKLIPSGHSRLTGSAPSAFMRGFAIVEAMLTSPPNADCSSIPKPNPSAVCATVGGKPTWTLPPPPPGTPLVLTANVVIVGNLTVSNSGSLVIKVLSDGSLPTVNVTDCATLQDSIVVELSDDDMKKIAKKPGSKTPPSVVLEAGCLSFMNGLKTSRAVKVSGAKSCRKASVTTTAQQKNSRILLSSVLTVDSSKCNTWWIIVIAVVGGVLLLGAIFLIVYFTNPKFRKCITPYQGSNA